MMYAMLHYYIYSFHYFSGNQLHIMCCQLLGPFSNINLNKFYFDFVCVCVCVCACVRACVRV